MILTNRLVQLIVILMTGGLLSIGLWGTLSLSQVLRGNVESQIEKNIHFL